VIYAAQFILLFFIGVRLYPFRSRAFSVFVLLSGAVLFWFSHALAAAPLHKYFLAKIYPAAIETVSGYMRYTIYEAAWMYLTEVCIVFALLYYRQTLETERALGTMRTQLATSELQVLKSQIEPHFLFNTLNAIYALAGKDVTACREMLLQLSNLLRAAVANRSEAEVPLETELEFVRDYLAIEKARLGSRLNVFVDVQDAAQKVNVPHLILQPIVENAIIHGIEPSAAHGEVAILGKLDCDHLMLEVINSADRATQRVKGMGVGMTNVRARLQHLYGTDAGLDFKLDDNTAYAKLRIPLRTASVEKASA
jgi:LytS/YehU family sensor histidine kinase